MKNTILNILAKYDIAPNDLNAIINAFEPITTVETGPNIIGHLNKVIGYNGYKPCNIGTEVYMLDNKYYVELHPINEQMPVYILYFSFNEISKCTDFINKDDGKF